MNYPSCVHLQGNKIDLKPNNSSNNPANNLSTSNPHGSTITLTMLMPLSIDSQDPTPAKTREEANKIFLGL